MSADSEKLPPHVAKEIRAIASDPSKHTAKFQFVCFGEEGVHRLAHALSKHRQLHELSLVSCDIGGRHGAESLARGLSNLLSLTTFILLGSNLTADGTKAIVSELKHCPALQHLTLSGNTVNVSVARTLARRVKHAKALHTLCLSDTHLGDDEMKELAAGLKHTTTLKELNLNNNHLGPAAALLLANALQGHANFRVLSLFDNHFEWEDGQTLSALCLPDHPVTILWTGPAQEAFAFEAAAARASEAKERQPTQAGARPQPDTCVETQPRKIRDPESAAMLRYAPKSTSSAVDSQRNTAPSDGAWTVQQKASIRQTTALETGYRPDPVPQHVYDGPKKNIGHGKADSNSQKRHVPAAEQPTPDTAASGTGNPADVSTVEVPAGFATSAKTHGGCAPPTASAATMAGGSSHLPPTVPTLEEQLAQSRQTIEQLTQELQKERDYRRSLENSLAHSQENAQKTRATTADQEAASAAELKQRLQDMDQAFARQVWALDKAHAETSDATYKLEQARVGAAKYQSWAEELRMENDALAKKYSELTKVVDHMQSENRELNQALQAAKAQARGRKFGQLEKHKERLQAELKPREQELGAAKHATKDLREELERKAQAHSSNEHSRKRDDRASQRDQKEQQRDLERLLNLRLQQEETLTVLRPIQMRGNFRSRVFLTSFKGTQVRACQVRVPPALELLKLPQQQDTGAPEGRVASALLSLLRLRHPNIACFMGLVEAATMQATAFILTAWEDSGTLYDFLHYHHHRHDHGSVGDGKQVQLEARHAEGSADSGPGTQLPMMTRYQILLDICRAMRYVSGHGLFHQRLNSMNVLLTATLTAKVTGFAESAIGFDDDDLTSETACWWASPEQLLENLVLHDTDVFSFGCIMWEVTLLSVPWHFPKRTLDHTQRDKYKDKPSVRHVNEAYQRRQVLPVDVSFGPGREIDPQHLRHAIAGCFQPSGSRISWYELARALHARLHISPPPPDAGQEQTSDGREDRGRCASFSGECSDDDACKGYVEVQGASEDAEAAPTRKRQGKGGGGKLAGKQKPSSCEGKGSQAQVEKERKLQLSRVSDEAEVSPNSDADTWGDATCTADGVDARMEDEEQEQSEAEAGEDDQGENGDKTVYGEEPVDEA